MVGDQREVKERQWGTDKGLGNTKEGKQFKDWGFLQGESVVVKSMSIRVRQTWVESSLITSCVGTGKVVWPLRACFSNEIIPTLNCTVYAEHSAW